MMNSYRYLLFDADNTLFDFDKCEKHAFELAFSENGEKYTDEIYCKYHLINDGIWKELEKGLIERDELKVERYRRLFEALGIEGDGYKSIAVSYEKLLAEQSFELDGAFEALGELSGEYGIYVVTNGLTSVQTGRFGASRLTRFIRKIYISEQMGVAKPDPRFFERVVSDIGDGDLSKYLVIGDSLSSDMDGAIAAGIDCCWFNPGGLNSGGRKITYTASGFSDIKALLRKQE